MIQCSPKQIDLISYEYMSTYSFFAAVSFSGAADDYDPQDCVPRPKDSGTSFGRSIKTEDMHIDGFLII